MRSYSLRKSLWLLVTISLFLMPISAQRRTPRRAAAEPQPPQQNISFDTLLAADTYKVYGEVRSVGQLIRSEGVKDLLDPIFKLAAPPKEFRSLVRWLNGRADALLTSRLLFAAFPSRPKLPQFLVAIEFPSPEEAQKFEPQLKDFLPKLFPTPPPESSPSPGQARSEKAENTDNEKPPPPPYLLKQAGPLVFITDAPFALKDLKPQGSKLLAEDRNFRVAHDRFNSDSVFVYVDFVGFEKEEIKKGEEEQKRVEAEAARQAKTSEPKKTEEEQPPVPEQPEPAVAEASPATEVTTEAVVVQEKPARPDPMDTALTAIAGSLFGGQARWPEGAGVSVVFDGDSYVVRVLLVNSPNEKGNAIPFFPQFISGPAIVSEAASVLPADTELLVSASLDFNQIHESMVKTAKAQFEQMQKNPLQQVSSVEPTSPFEVLEKKLGIKIKDDLLPLLGNEIAVTIPMKVLDAGPPEPKPSPSPSENNDEKQKKPAEEGPDPILAISIRDREATRAVLQKAIESLGFKGASMLAQTEKRDDTELVTFADAFAYAFIGNFLIASGDVKATRHVVDSYLKHETLSSSTHYRNYTRWQPRQVQGQFYLSPALMESYNSYARDATAQISDQLRDFLMMLSPVAQPVTYALTDEGQGPLHELHLPKNLVMLMVAGMSGETNTSPIASNEAQAQASLRSIAAAESKFQSGVGASRYGTMDELVKAELLPKGMESNSGYKIELMVSNARYEISAVPIEYGKTGKLSFFMDDSSVLRAGDHGGGPATISDRPYP